MMFRLTRAADYAILAMLHLGSLPDGGSALTGDVARAQDIPPSFLARILRRLVKTGLLRSARGVNGGFGLRRSADEINLLDIVEGIEGSNRVGRWCSRPRSPFGSSRSRHERRVARGATRGDRAASQDDARGTVVGAAEEWAGRIQHSTLKRRLLPRGAMGRDVRGRIPA